MRKLPDIAIQIVKAFEGCCLDVYVCPGGYRTIGYGHLLRKGDITDCISREEAEELLELDLNKAQRWAVRLTGVELTDNQLGALTSFIFNVGSGNYQRSTMRMLMNRGDFDGAANEFWKWRRSKGVILRGLVLRREACRALFEANDL